MNWKSTALAGAGLLATWFAAAPPARHPMVTTAAPIRPAAHSADAAADIVREADRLRARLDTVAAYHEPGRNPFRFGQPPPQPHVAAAPPAIVQPTVPVVVPQAAPQITLSGIAEDTSAGQIVRTAVINAAGEVLLVKEGDSVLGQYLVSGVTADAVELKRTADGVVVRLALRP